MPQKQHVTISIKADMAFIKLATSFVENSAIAFGMDQSEALALTLATEEIFAHLCGLGTPHQDFEIRCTGGVYYVQVQFLFDAQDFDLRSFNLTATASVQDHTILTETGLLIASRMVDRFDFSAADGKKHRLTFIKDKVYPNLAEIDLPKTPAAGDFSYKMPDTEETKLFVQLVRLHNADEILPPFFSFPGKVADMLASGEYQATLARNENGRIGGGILWNMATPTIAACYGPYVFAPTSEARSEMAQELVDRCIEKVARTQAVGLISRYPSRDLPDEYFEKLGSLSYSTGEKHTRELPIFFRQLLEDPGTTVWCHPKMETFLRDEFQRLFLGRQLLTVHSQGEATAVYSVLSAEFDRPNGQVTLNPVLSGADAEENLTRHVEMLLKEGLTSILFQMDLGKPWQAVFVPALLKNKFEPRVILPHAGNRDLVVFQLKTGDLTG